MAREGTEVSLDAHRDARQRLARSMLEVTTVTMDNLLEFVVITRIDRIFANWQRL